MAGQIERLKTDPQQLLLELYDQLEAIFSNRTVNSEPDQWGMCVEGCSCRFLRAFGVCGASSCGVPGKVFSLFSLLFLDAALCRGSSNRV